MSRTTSSKRARAVLVLAGMVVLVAAPRGQAAFPSLYVNYKTEDCTFRLTNDSGAAVSTIAPGTYQIVITTPDPYGVFGQTDGLAACKGFIQFRLNGPGVSVYTTLDYGDGTSEIYPATFQPGATYTIQDDNNIAGTRRTINVSTSGSAAPAPSPAKGTSAGASDALATLHGIVARNGKLSLRRNGKAVTSLKAGRYTFSIDDQSTKLGFRLQVLNGKAQTITSAGYVGWQETTLTLVPGRWSFFTPGGQRTVFVVVAGR
jgi:hypothetical protein